MEKIGQENAEAVWQPLRLSLAQFKWSFLFRLMGVRFLSLATKRILTKCSIQANNGGQEKDDLSKTQKTEY